MMQEKFIEVDNNKIRYLESGNSKNVLVLVHGLGASAERWINVIPAFAKHYRVIVPDLIGYGYSDKPILDYIPSLFSEFLGKFFDILKIDHAFLIGSSLGGQVTASYTAANPAKVDKLVLMSPAGAMKQSTPALDAYIMAALYPNEQSARNAFNLMEPSGEQVDDDTIQSFIERMQLPNAKLAFMSTVLGLKNSEIITPTLHNIKCPTLVIWGAKDPVIPIEYAESFVPYIKDCKYIKIDNWGHTPYVHDPIEFSSLVLEFLSS